MYMKCLNARIKGGVAGGRMTGRCRFENGFALHEVHKGEVLFLPVSKRVGEVTGARPSEEGSSLRLSIG